LYEAEYCWSGNYVGGVLNPIYLVLILWDNTSKQSESVYSWPQLWIYLSCYYDANIDYELIGYIERAVFFLAGVDYAAPSGLNDWDLLHIYLENHKQLHYAPIRGTEVVQYYVGYRKNGSTDARTVYVCSGSDTKGCQCGVCIAPTDTASILEI